MEGGNRFIAKAIREKSQRVFEFVGKPAGIPAVVVSGAASKAAIGVSCVVLFCVCLLEKRLVVVDEWRGDGIL